MPGLISKSYVEQAIEPLSDSNQSLSRVTKNSGGGDGLEYCKCIAGTGAVY
jgi:hypothetical protein